MEEPSKNRDNDSQSQILSWSIQFLELQDDENPYHFWPVTVMQNRGSFLTLKYVKFDDHEETIFYLSPKLYPKGFAEQKEVNFSAKN